MEDTAIARGEALQAEGDYMAAVFAFTDAIKLCPDGDDAYKLRALAYVNLKLHAEALKDAELLLGRNPQKAEWYTLRANIYQAAERYNDAMRDYETAIAIGPMTCGDFTGWAIAKTFVTFTEDELLELQRRARLWDKVALASARRKAEPILACMDAAVRSFADECNVYRVRGRILCLIRDLDGAIRDFTKALELASDPIEEMECYLARGDILCDKGCIEESRDVFEKGKEDGVTAAKLMQDFKKANQ